MEKVNRRNQSMQTKKNARHSLFFFVSLENNRCTGQACAQYMSSTDLPGRGFLCDKLEVEIRKQNSSSELGRNLFLRLQLRFLSAMLTHVLKTDFNECEININQLETVTGRNQQKCLIQDNQFSVVATWQLLSCEVIRLTLWVKLLVLHGSLSIFYFDLPSPGASFIMQRKPKLLVLLLK